MTNTAATSSSYSAAHRTKLFQEMEIQFDTKNQDYFAKLLNHSDSIIRTRAICILADIAGENAVSPISKVLRDDENALVRHEAAFSLGQLGFSGGINALTQAVKRDPSLFVRHESAI